MGNTLTGQIVAETYEALLKVTDNGIITGTKKRITDGFGNDTPLLLSSTDVQIDGNFLLPGTTLQYVRGDGSLATFPTIISTLTTTGSSGASTLIGSTLNIPNYTLTGLGGVPTSRTLTINGTTFDLSANRSWTITDTGLTSVGISMPSAFTVSNSPLTANGTIAITGAGLASQYIRGDGTLANFPTTGGGGSSVSYYMNGSVNQGTILGNTYYEFNKTPIIGAGTDFTINANGYISQFITDANDPALLEIPGGNWNFEMYFSASSGGGSPSFYVELYKYNGTAFTLIASNSTTPEGITGGTVIDLYTTALAVPQTVLTLTDRLAIRVYVTHSGRTITLHTENSHLCQVITTFSTGINALNSLTKQVQYFAVGTSGTDFAISSVTDTHTFNLPTASATNRGALSSADWTIFNGKVGGSGTTNYVPKFSASTTLGNSLIFDNGTQVGIGTASPASTLDVSGNITSSSNVRALRFWGGPSVFTSHGAPLHIFSSTIGTSPIARFNNNESTDASTLTSMWLENYSGFRAELAYTTHLNGSNIYINNTYSSGNILFNIAGSEKLRIASSGNVGIGTTSPFYSLDLTGQTIRTARIYSGSSDTRMYLQNTTSGNPTTDAGLMIGLIANDSYFYNYQSGNSIFGTAGSERMRITSAGAVGIGTSSPNEKLSVIGAISANNGMIVQGYSAAASGLNCEMGVVSGYVQYNAYNRSTSAYGSFKLDGSNILLNSGSGGNVGIGTTSPSSILHIQTASGTASKLYIGQAATAAWSIGNNASANTFSIIDEQFSATRLFIGSSGNVGIGTTSPSALLHVASLTNNAQVLVRGNGVNVRAQINTVNDYGDWLWGVAGGDTSGDGLIYTGQSKNFKLFTNDTERMRITSGGNVLIGTTDAPGLLGVKGNGTSNYAASISNTVANNNVLLLSGTSDSTSQNKVVFANGGSVTGTIFTTATTTTYNITSDYRLKEDLREIKGLEKLLKLKVYDFKWKDSEDRMDGVLAHELQEVIPYAVAGEKDGENMQGVDYSKIVPILVKAIQELKAELDELKNNK